jgi:hypothetical protein
VLAPDQTPVLLRHEQYNTNANAKAPRYGRTQRGLEDGVRRSGSGRLVSHQRHNLAYWSWVTPHLNFGIATRSTPFTATFKTSSRLTSHLAAAAPTTPMPGISPYPAYNFAPTTTGHSDHDLPSGLAAAPPPPGRSSRGRCGTHPPSQESVCHRCRYRCPRPFPFPFPRARGRMAVERKDREGHQWLRRHSESPQSTSKCPLPS